MNDAAPELLARLLIDQSERWQRGEPIAIEVYQRQHPFLTDDDALLDLISNEIYVRQLRGEAPALAEYRERFPRLAEPIELQFQLHQAAGGGALATAVTLPRLVSAPAAPLPAIPGHELIEEIGRGAMGIVYKAWQNGLRRVVALKVLLIGGRDRAVVQARFRVEAEAVARLQHPNIVQIFEVGDHESSSFIALELVDGGNLAQRIKNAPPGAVESARCIRALAQAVHYAHQRGVIHRDLKPANILLAKDGTPKITDFGLARQTASDRRLTQFGDIIGTPSYMAPEQAWGNRPVLAAADIYALGAILYELMTGRPPFRGESAYDTLMKVATEAPPAPAVLRPGVDPDLNAICLKCLAKEPADRYPTAAALADDLGRFLDDFPVAVRPVGAGMRLFKWARRSPVRAALSASVALAALAIVAGAVYLGARLRAEHDRVDQDRLRLASEVEAIRADALGVAAQRDEALNGYAILEAQRDAARDELRAAEAARDAARLEAGRLGPAATGAERDAARQAQLDAEQRLRVASQRLDQVRRELFALQLLAAGAVWATDPDRARLILHDESRCPPEFRDFTWSMLESACDRPRLKLDGRAGVVRAIAVAPDGKTFATAGEDGVVRLWNADTRRQKQALSRRKGAVNAIAFDPKGKLLAAAGDDSSIQIWDAAGKHLRTLSSHKRPIHALAFSPNGKVLASAGDEGIIRLWDAHTDKELGEIKKAHSGAIRALAFDPGRDGKVLASAGDEAVIKFWDDKKLTQLTSLKGHLGTIGALAYSPDGRLLASAGSDGAPRVWDKATDTAKFILAGHTGPIAALAFSDDGRFLATAAAEAGAAKDKASGSLRLWDSASGRPLAIFPDQAPMASVAFLNGGRLAVGTGSSAEIWLMACPAEQSAFSLANGSLSALTLAPDGETLAGAQDNLIKLFDPVTGAVRESLKGNAGNVTALAYRSDAKVLASGSADGSLRLWDAVQAKLQSETEAHTDGVTCLSFAPDGKLLVTGGKDRLVKVWNPAANQLSATLIGHDAPITCVAVAPDGQMLASADSEGALKLWKPSGELIRNLAVIGETIQALTFMPDSAVLAAGSADGTVTLCDVGSGKVVQKLTVGHGAVMCLAASPDGKTLAVGAGPANSDAMRGLGDVRLWDPVAGQLRAILPGHGKRLVMLSFTVDSRRLMSGAEDGTVKVWGAALVK